jgi:GDP-4-dehydro-6-deoxy-D-mannose reductase
MVRAYLLLAQKGAVGEAYNLGSGRGVTIQKILDELISLSGHEISVEVDPDRYRASDNPVLICDNSKFSQQTGWKPEFTLEKTLADMLEYWCHI